MRCILQGEFLGSGKITSKKTGKEYEYTDILSEKGLVRVFGIKAEIERLTPIEILVDIWVNRNGKLVIKPVEKA